MPDPSAPVLIESPLSDEEDRVLQLAMRQFAPYRPSSYRKAPPHRPKAPPPSHPAPTARARVHWRHDVSTNLLRTGGRLAHLNEPPGLLAARNNYLRGNLVFGGQISVPEVATFLRNKTLLEASRHTFGRSLVVPEWIYVNILLPGQELAVHTDVPEFVGARRDRLPGWLLATMHHSGLFETRRIPVATAVTYVTDATAGAFVYYPADWTESPVVLSPRRNTALMFDADSIFHAVDRTDGDNVGALMALTSSSSLTRQGHGDWALTDGETVLANYRTEELRFSVSWKALCFTDQAEHDRFLTGADELGPVAIVARMIGDLRNRGVLAPGLSQPKGRALAELLIEQFIPFPPASLPG